MSDKNYNIMSDENYNQILKNQLQILRQKSLTVKNTNDLLQICQDFYQATPQLKFNNNKLYKYCLISIFISSIVSIVIFFLNKNNHPTDQQTIYPLIIAIIIIPVIILTLAILFSRGTSPKVIGKLLFFKSVLFDYDLLSYNETISLIFNKYQKLFNELNRGNHSNHFIVFYGGEWKKKSIAFDYKLFHYHYVNREIQTYHDGKRLRTRTVLVDYHKHGIITDFPFFNNIAISSKKVPNIQYKKHSTTLNKFNKKFSLSFKDEIEIVKFLKPKILLSIMDITKLLSSMNIEINYRGQMMISHTNNVFQIPQPPDISQQKEFIHALKEDVIIDQLNKTLDFIGILLKYSDNNFS